MTNSKIKKISGVYCNLVPKKVTSIPYQEPWNRDLKSGSGMGSVCVWPDFALPPFSSPLWPLGNCNQTPGPQPRCTS